MLTEFLKIVSIPFLGTSLGAANVFFLRKSIPPLFNKAMNGFAAGIMIAASVWSLIIPAIELSEKNCRAPFLPAAIGLWFGIFLFYIADKLLLAKHEKPDIVTHHHNPFMPILAIVIHNIPEGMALGVVFTAWAKGGDAVSYNSVLALALGIGVQNFPEGSIISLPLYGDGMRRSRAFLTGVLSAIAEALGSIITLLASRVILPLLPYLMCFAAGAMIFVVICELCPEMSDEGNSHFSVLLFALGFSVMMILDVALG